MLSAAIYGTRGDCIRITVELNGRAVRAVRALELDNAGTPVLPRAEREPRPERVIVLFDVVVAVGGGPPYERVK
jgi:hypothetical protein